MPHGDRTLFFATRSDLAVPIKNVESHLKVRYYHVSFPERPVFATYDSILDDPDLGVCHSGRTAERQYLVMKVATKLKVNEIPQKSGGDPVEIIKTLAPGIHVGKLKPPDPHAQIIGSRFEMANQLLNPDSITMDFGGVYKDLGVVRGTMATISESQDSRELYKAFQGAFRRAFKKIDMYYIGPEALSLAHEGLRLLPNGWGSPKEYDANRWLPRE